MQVERTYSNAKSLPEGYNFINEFELVVDGQVIFQDENNFASLPLSKQLPEAKLVLLPTVYVNVGKWYFEEGFCSEIFSNEVYLCTSINKGICTMAVFRKGQSKPVGVRTVHAVRVRKIWRVTNG